MRSQEFGGECLSGHLVGPIRAGIEPRESGLHAGKVALDAVEIQRHSCGHDVVGGGVVRRIVLLAVVHDREVTHR